MHTILVLVQYSHNKVPGTVVLQYSTMLRTLETGDEREYKYEYYSMNVTLDTDGKKAHNGVL